MKYMLMMNSPRDGYTQYLSWPKKILEVTDGVFPESKEFLAGYWIVDVASPERADELAAELSTAPGGTITAADGTVLQHFWIEVREVMGSHQDLG